MSEDLGKKEDINLKRKKQIDKSKWQRECRAREKKYLVKYDPDRYWKQSEGVCNFCTRTMYLDSHHVNAEGSIVGEEKVGHWFPHDRYYSEGDPGGDVKHHFTHCPDFWGDEEAKKFYAELRRIKGMPDPYKNKKIKKLAEVVEKNDEDKKIVPPQRVVTLDDMLDKEAKQEITTAPYIYKIVIEVKSHTYNLDDEVVNKLLDTYAIDNISINTIPN